MSQALCLKMSNSRARQSKNKKASQSCQRSLWRLSCQAPTFRLRKAYCEHLYQLHLWPHREVGERNAACSHKLISGYQSLGVFLEAHSRHYKISTERWATLLSMAEAFNIMLFAVNNCEATDDLIFARNSYSMYSSCNKKRGIGTYSFNKNKFEDSMVSAVYGSRWQHMELLTLFWTFIRI